MGREMGDDSLINARRPRVRLRPYSGSDAHSSFAPLVIRVVRT